MSAGRVEVSGWFGAAASTHWLATQSAMGVLERGGNAFDAAVVAGLVMQVAQPHFNGPAGDVAILLHHAADGTVSSICGQGCTPAAATIDKFCELDLDLIPGTGLLPAVVPGAFDAWMALLADHGTLNLAEVFEPAITYARAGIEIDERLHDTLAAAAPMFRRYWQSSGALFLDPSGDPPPVGALLTNAPLAQTWQRLCAEAAAASPDRIGQIEAARAIWSDGFIAGAVDEFCRSAQVMDVTGRVHPALLTGADMSGWRATSEPVVTTRFAGHTIHKCSLWTQGPTLLQALNIADADHLRAQGPVSAGFVHYLTEAAKLALADRDAHYGLADPDDAEAVLSDLLSEAYTKARRALLTDRASDRFRPGRDIGVWQPDYAAATGRQREAGLLAAYGGGEPTIVYELVQPGLSRQDRAAHMARAVGDTSYLSVTDAAGNVVSATPSGGWLQSSPVIPELGFALGTRAQMMWLDPASPSALAPRTRPRSTLTPTLVTNEAGDVLAVGTPGGDQQDQWQLVFLARHLAQGLPLQEALDAPGFHTNHLVNSFYPRGAQPASLIVEDRFAEDEIADLRARGHQVTVVGGWVESRLCALRAGADGQRRAAVTQRGAQALAVAR
ncbi:MAG: gamma-glutamyltransferase [Aestuariivita sp.]|uniref:gamma-glutamyltransferase family protein n=1 Tax=Aestuariivita sp. TaxID=1872407 RepID=UPI003BAF1AE9